MTWIRNRPLGLVYRDRAKTFGGYTLFSPVRGHHADLLDPEGRIVHQWHHVEGIQHLLLRVRDSPRVGRGNLGRSARLLNRTFRLSR